jgi:parallel beta-helix repeat protein
MKNILSKLFILSIAFIFFGMIVPSVISVDITSCGSYSINDETAYINITVFDINPCLELSINNATLTCSDNILGTYEVFAYISKLNNSIIENCNLSTFLQGFLIPNAYYVAEYTSDNIIRNVSIDTFSSGGFGFDIESSLGQYMNNISFYNNHLYMSYDNTALSLYGDGITNVNIHDNTLSATYSGIASYYTSNLTINNNIIDSGTIFGIYILGVSNPVISNNNISDYAVCGIALDGVSNALLYNNDNEVDILDLVNIKFCMGENPSSIDIFSSYNRGWFPDNRFVTNTYSVDDNSFYNLSNSYDVYFEYENNTYHMERNLTKSYFINPECIENWIKDVNPCINTVRLISYHDTSLCNSLNNLPSDNSTNEYCNITQQTVYDESILILGILAFFILVALVCAIFVHEAFFGLTALLFGLVMSIFIYYDYPQILTYVCIFMILMFSVMWIVVHKVRRS